MNEVAKRMRQSYEVTGDKWILRAAEEIEGLRRLLDDKLYIRIKADYNDGHLSHNGWLASREKAALTTPERGEK